eukprot:2199868-Prymnesium_polylepis.1
MIRVAGAMRQDGAGWGRMWQDAGRTLSGTRPAHLFDDEERDRLGRLDVGPAGARVDQVDVAQLRVGRAAVGDPHLGAVEHPPACAIPPRAMTPRS